MKSHVFPFSKRKGTPAATMDGQVQSREIRDRAARADTLNAELAQSFAKSRVGTTAGALIEGRRIEGRLTGLTGRYLRVELDGDDHLMNQIVPVRIAGLTNGRVNAEVIEQ